MNTRTIAVEFLPAMGAAEQVPVVASPQAFSTLVLFEELAVEAKPRRRRGLAPSSGRTGESWETLTYFALWICGWAGIVFCLL